MAVNIRKIEKTDYKAVVSMWNHELGYPEVTLESFKGHLEAMSLDDSYKTFVAVKDDDVCGFITVLKILSFEVPTGYLKIEGLAVNEANQGQGIGKALMAYAEKLAKDLGLSYVFLDSRIHRKGAHAFYKRIGYEQKALCFSKDL